MSRIKGKNTKPEILLRKRLHSARLRFSLHSDKLPGKPDIVLRKYKTTIFVHGCYWHGHKNCKYFRLPKSNTIFWKEKIEANIKRDHENIQELISKGWNVLIVWECQGSSNISGGLSF